MGVKLEHLKFDSLQCGAAPKAKKGTQNVVLQAICRRSSNTMPERNGVPDFVNKSAASAASLDYVKFRAVNESAASTASLRGGRASGRLDHGFFVQFLAALAAKK